jgi:hypothetical protein
MSADVDILVPGTCQASARHSPGFASVLSGRDWLHASLMPSRPTATLAATYSAAFRVPSSGFRSGMVRWQSVQSAHIVKRTMSCAICPAAHLGFHMVCRPILNLPTVMRVTNLPTCCRTDALAAASEIKHTAYSPADVMALFAAFQRQAADALLFLKCAHLLVVFSHLRHG